MRAYVPQKPETVIPEPTAPDFKNRLVDVLSFIDYWAQDAAFGFNRITLGQVPNGSGAPLGGGGTLTNYWFKPGISDAFIAYMSTLPGVNAGISGYISSTSSDTKGTLAIGYPTAVGYFDEFNSRLGVGVQPSAILHLAGNSTSTSARPVNTSGGIGNWKTQSGGTTNLEAVVNEPVLDESTYVTETTSGGAGSAIFFTLWTAGNIPFSGTPNISITFRCRRDPLNANTGNETLAFDLRRAAVNVFTNAESSTGITTAWTNFTRTLSASEVTSLYGTGTSDASIRMFVAHIGGPGGYDVSQITMSITTLNSQEIMEWDVDGTQLGGINSSGRLKYLTSGNVMTLLGTPTGTRNVTFPDATTTLAGLAVAQTFTKAQTITPDSDVTGLTLNSFSGATGSLVTVNDVDGGTAVLGAAGVFNSVTGAAGVAIGGELRFYQGTVYSGVSHKMTSLATGQRGITLPDATGQALVVIGPATRTNSTTTGSTNLITTGANVGGMFQITIVVANGSTAGDRVLTVVLGWTDERGARTSNIVPGYALASTATSQAQYTQTYGIRSASGTAVTLTFSFASGTTGTYNASYGMLKAV